jgi:crotonobetainyl-CoA:carnitine CoA-transferase CaiB-like acyl-CoA transferase
LLRGVRVLEVSHAVAGPTACQILADYGAEVIKLERPGTGDIFRNTPGMGPSMFLAINRGKKSVVIDLKSKPGLELFYRLVRLSDVIVENMGPGVAERLGITYRRIKKENARAIYCKIESFGKGPYEKIPAFDPVLQAAVGIMSTTGFPPDRYVRAGVSIVDVSCGLHAATGVVALLYQRTLSGVGGRLNVSLYGAASYFMSYWIALFDLFGKDTRPLGTSHIFGSPYSLFSTTDGHVYIAIASDDAWISFCKALGFTDLLADKKYRNASRRVKYKKELEEMIAKRLVKFRSDQLVKMLKDTGVPIAKLNTASTLLKDPHFLGSGLVGPYKYQGRSFRTVVNPTRVDGSRQYARESPPKLGSDTESVLKSLLKVGINELENLKEAGVIPR